MSNESKIEWTDATWNPVRGCTKISPGCKNCYAETFAERWRGVPGHPYEQGFDLRIVPEKLEEPLRWKKPRRVFVNSMSDLFQDGVPFEFVEVVLGIGLWSPHTLQILTKRADRMEQFFSQTSPQRCCDAATDWVNDSDNQRLMPKEWTEPSDWSEAERIWLGVSVENQQYADERIPLLLQTAAAKRFISYEPALGPIDLTNVKIPVGSMDALTGRHLGEDGYCVESLDWVIVGGESGPGARPFDIQWARDVVQQCTAAGIACFVKQLGSKPIRPWRQDEDTESLLCEGEDESKVTLEMVLKSRKGGDMAEWPEDLRVRQFPS